MLKIIQYRALKRYNIYHSTWKSILENNKNDKYTIHCDKPAIIIRKSIISKYAESLRKYIFFFHL